MPLVKLENVSQVFGLSDVAKIALNSINLEIQTGDFVVVMGPNGSGKTSLLNLIGLLNRPTKGIYTLANHNTQQLSQTKQAKLRQKNIGFIFQHPRLLDDLNILDNVALPLLYSSRLNSLKRLQKIKKSLNRLGIHQKEFLYPFQLSNGQVQRVAIARAIINQPRLILADQPTGSLDSINGELIMHILDNIHQQGATIVMTTHNPVFTKYANRIIYIHDGEIRINQKLKADQQVDLGKIQDVIRRQDFNRQPSSTKQGRT